MATSVVRERMGKAPAVQTGLALPMGSCASPPLVPHIESEGHAFIACCSSYRVTRSFAMCGIPCTYSDTLKNVQNK